MITARRQMQLCSIVLRRVDRHVVCQTPRKPNSRSQLRRRLLILARPSSNWRQVIEDELQRGILTGLSVALVDGQQVVLTAGFGMADTRRQVPATADTVYRVGSISKLFTALATLQLVEQGKLDLDAPLHKALPGFHIVDPFANANPITLRQLMCHRSGLVRESPVGGYLDDSQPSIAESIASLESCVLVNPPNTKTRYSNIGVTVVGQAVASASGLPFQQYQRNNLLDPLGMAHSSWRVDDRISDNLGDWLYACGRRARRVLSSCGAALRAGDDPGWQPLLQRQ